jgi:eukaryotic-like serine/threonine-protein kinase
MDPKALTLFRELADRSSAEREAYYIDHHVDSALRAEIESLLRFDRQSADSLHKYVASAAADVVGDRPPSLTPPLVGRRFGVFEIQGFLGAGGMGEVYRARDTRLGRDVAIKILPHAFRDDRDRVARFEREARVLASLNHPHIGVVHGLEEVDGVQALVMELVEGEDLAERIKRALPPVREALDVARQVADALEAAHAQGVVHRDLKPANIRRRPDGEVKVLDFGLAKAPSWDSDPLHATQTGVVAGTPAYMSPEQVRGETVDGQADVWSFGIVLFELFSGVSPFVRKTAPETLASVIAADPDYSLLPINTPANVRYLIRRCLEKDRRRRLKHIGDARLELEEALTPSAVDVTAAPAHAGARPETARWWSVHRAGGLAIAAGVGAGAIGIVWLSARPGPSPVVRTTILAETLWSSTDRSFAFTPDGNSLAYINGDARQILVRRMDALEPLVILTTAAYIRGMYPSPNGRWLGYVENNFTLRKIPTSGGAPVTVLTMDGPSRGAAWGADDAIVFATGASDTGLQRVASGGGAVTVLTRPDPKRGEADHVQPTLLPGGRRLLYTILSARGGLDAAKIAVLDLETGATRTVLEGGYGARYAGGHLVYAAAGALWATRFDLSPLEIQGSPVEVVRPVAIDTVGAGAEFDIAVDGTLVYSTAAASSNRFVPVWVDREGRETPLPAPPAVYRHPRLSPDGRRLAVDPQGGGQGDIYIWEIARPWSSAARLTVAPGNDWFPVWTPDGREIVFGSWRAGFSNIYKVNVESGSTERLTDSPDMQLPTSITPDGKTVIFHSFMKSLQALPLDGRREAVTLVETPFEERNGEVSPDGRWLAYESESPSLPGQLDIFVRRFPGSDGAVWQVTTDGATFPLWSRDGRELFYVARDETLVAVPVEASETTWKAGSPKKLFRGRYFFREGSLGRQYDIASDGRFLMLKRDEVDRAPHLVVVQNWLAELARRVR